MIYLLVTAHDSETDEELASDEIHPGAEILEKISNIFERAKQKALEIKEEALKQP